MTDQKKPKEFSMKIDTISFNLEQLRGLGEEKLVEVRQQAMLQQMANTALFIICGVTVAVFHMADNLFSTPENNEALQQFFSNADMVVKGITAAVGINAIFDFLDKNERRKKADQAIVLISGDMGKAEFSSTSKQLVKQGYFKKEKTGEYLPV